MTSVNASLPKGYELLIREGVRPRRYGPATLSYPYEAIVRSVKSGLSGGSCREYLGGGKTPESALAAVLRLLRCSVAETKVRGFFQFVRQCAILLGIQDTPDEALMVEDPSWYGCYDDGLTPEEAVAEFKSNTPWDSSKRLAADLLKGALT